MKARPSDLALLLLTVTSPVSLLRSCPSFPHPILLFSGTRTLSDMRDNLSLFPPSHWPRPSFRKKRGGGFVHRGYARRARSLLTPSFLSTCSSLSSPLLLAGHSAGGATSVLVAHFLVQECGIEVEEVHTFGAPKFASPSFVESYSQTEVGSRTWRHATLGDPVPSLPPFYRHVGTPSYVSNVACSVGGGEGGDLFVAEHKLECFLGD